MNQAVNFYSQPPRTFAISICADNILIISSKENQFDFFIKNCCNRIRARITKRRLCRRIFLWKTKVAGELCRHNHVYCIVFMLGIARINAIGMKIFEKTKIVFRINWLISCGLLWLVRRNGCIKKVGTRSRGNIPVTWKSHRNGATQDVKFIWNARTGSGHQVYDEFFWLHEPSVSLNVWYQFQCFFAIFGISICV